MSQLLQVATRTGVLLAVEGSAPPTHYDQGIPYDGEFVAVSYSFAISHYHQGLPFNNVGRIAAFVGPPASIQSGPIPLSSTGRLAASLDAEISNYNGGVPYGSDGGLFVNDALPPPLTAFTDGFSDGFF